MVAILAGKYDLCSPSILRVMAIFCENFTFLVKKQKKVIEVFFYLMGAQYIDNGPTSHTRSRGNLP